MNTASAQTAPRQGEAESRDPLAEGASARAYVELLEPHWLSAIESATD